MMLSRGAFDSIERPGDTLARGALRSIDRPGKAIASPRRTRGSAVNIPPQAPLHLLHRVPDGTLATHSRDPRGFPYPTALPFAPTARHLPMLLISHLAEHTRNLHADARAGFLVAHAADGSVLEGQRLTMLGVVRARGGRRSVRSRAPLFALSPRCRAISRIRRFHFLDDVAGTNAVYRRIRCNGLARCRSARSARSACWRMRNRRCANFSMILSGARRRIWSYWESTDTDAISCRTGRRNRFTFDKPKLTIDGFESCA